LTKKYASTSCGEINAEVTDLMPDTTSSVNHQPAKTLWQESLKTLEAPQNVELNARWGGFSDARYHHQPVISTIPSNGDSIQIGQTHKQTPLRSVAPMKKKNLTLICLHA
jgi:hypothetical protein